MKSSSGLVFNNNQVSPQRLHALVKLVVYTDDLNRDTIFETIQPMDNNRSSAVAVFNMAIGLGLIHESPDDKDRILSRLNIEDVNTIDAFQQVLSQLLLSQVDENDPQYLLNLFAAWFAVQNDAVIYERHDDLANRFNKQMLPNRDKQSTFNETKMVGWIRWAAFVGWGRLISKGGRDYLMPDATLRIKPLIPKILNEVNQPMQFVNFLQRIGELCPELDSGKLFEYCQSLGTQSHTLSLMLSTALISLQETGIIQIKKIDDSGRVFELFTGYKTLQVSQIERII